MRTKSKVSNGFLKTKIILSILLSSFCFNHVLLSQEHEAAFSSTNPSIDGQIDNSEWQNANTYDIMFIRTDGYDTHYGKLYLQHNDIWLYVGIESEWISGWDVYMQLRFDGNNDNLLAGNSSTPHTDIQVEYPSPDGWSGYNNYQYIAGNNAYPTTEPTGTQRASYGSTSVTYEYCIKISDLNVGLGRIFGFYILHGTDGTSGHSYEYPLNNIRNTPSQWTEVLLENSNYEVRLSSISPIIDGHIDNYEWNQANNYNIAFSRNDGSFDHFGKIYLQYDGFSWLYIGIESEWGSGWDVYMQLRFDGNNDNLLAGNSSTPHTDIQVEYPSPDGWSGYNNYQYIAGNNAYPTTEPTGTQRESDGSSNVTYEFSIFISDLNIINPNRTFGFYMLHGTDGTSEHNFEFPKNNIRNDATKWQHITFQYPLSNTPLKHYKSIKISPNPIIDELLVTVNQDVLFPVKIEIIDNKGVTVQKQLITTIHSKIDCRNLIEGIYCLRCVSINNEVFWTAKVIKL